MLSYFLNVLVPSPAGAFWFGLLVAIIVFGDFDQIRSRRNLSLAAVLALAVLLLDVMRWNERPDSALAGWAFTGIYLGTAAYAAWGLFLSRRMTPIGWSCNLTRSGLRVILTIVLVVNAIVVFGREPDDAGYYTNLGARRWVETGVLPYGDTKLKGPDAPAYGAAATYGPLLYVSHVPFQWIIAVESNPADADPMDSTYARPPVLSTQMATFAFFLAGLWALYTIVARLHNPDIALGVTALYAASPYVLGLGGTDHVVGGLAFVSHIAPSSVMLLAFAALHRPAWAGALLAAAAGVLFFPIFVFPAWFGWFVWQRRGIRPFVLGFVGAGLLIGAMVAVFTPVPEGSNIISVFLESTLEHQEGVGPLEYGASQFGFWGTHPRLAAFWQTPMVGSSSLFKPTFLLYALACLAAFFLARGRTVAQLAGITAALTAGVQLWKTHAAGSYVEWYLPFLLIALFTVGQRSREGIRD